MYRYEYKLKQELNLQKKAGVIKDQTAFAKSIGVASCTLSGIITGYINPSIDLKNKIAAGLGKSVKEIFLKK